MHINNMGMKILQLMKQSLINIGDRLFYQTLENELYDCRSVLDVGCGSNSPLGKIRKHFRSEGVDIYRKSIIDSKKKKIHDTYKICDIKQISRIYKKKSFDGVVLLDVIEHIEKEAGRKLLQDLFAIARKKVIILTTNGFIDLHSDRKDIYMRHKSGWTKDDFQQYGFRCYGLRGLKGLRDNSANIKYKPWILWGIITVITEYLTYYLPDFATEILAIKRLDTNQ